MLAIRSPETKSSSSRGKRNQQTEVDLNFYSNVPNYELSLDEFEKMALARLKVRPLIPQRYDDVENQINFNIRLFQFIHMISRIRYETNPKSFIILTVLHFDYRYFVK